MIKQPWEQAVMRDTGRRLGRVREQLRLALVIGLTPLELDAKARELIAAEGARPSFLDYDPGQGPFPAAICVSRGSVVVHGIPDEEPFRHGELVSVDLGMVRSGYHADTAFTVYLGEEPDGPGTFELPQAIGRLMAGTVAALQVGVQAARPGNTVGDLGAAIQAVAEEHSLGVVRDLAGHGIGRQLHEPPSVPNFGKRGSGLRLQAGMTLAIEPMFTLSHGRVRTLPDGWGVGAVGGFPGAHEEHTVLVRESGPAEVLTAAARLLPRV